MYVCRRRAFVLSSPAHAAEALSFLRDQERKQRSRRECDSPLPTDVGSGNRTFPGQQPLPVLRYQVSNREYFLNLRFIEMFSLSQALAGGGSGLTATRTINRTFSSPAVPVLYGKRSYPSSGRPTVLSCAAIVVIPDSRAPIPGCPKPSRHSFTLSGCESGGIGDAETADARLFSACFRPGILCRPFHILIQFGCGMEREIRIS